jgi:hypothetical protein
MIGRALGSEARSCLPEQTVEVTCRQTHEPEEKLDGFKPSVCFAFCRINLQPGERLFECAAEMLLSWLRVVVPREYFLDLCVLK